MNCVCAGIDAGYTQGPTAKQPSMIGSVAFTGVGRSVMSVPLSGADLLLSGSLPPLPPSLQQRDNNNASSGGVVARSAPPPPPPPPPPSPRAGLPAGPSLSTAASSAVPVGPSSSSAAPIQESFADVVDASDAPVIPSQRASLLDAIKGMSVNKLRSKEESAIASQKVQKKADQTKPLSMQDALRERLARRNE